MNYYKILNADGEPCNGGSGAWHLPKGKRPGRWMPRLRNIIPCKRGYHLVEAKDILQWLQGDYIYLAEGRGEHVEHGGNKHVFSQARLIRQAMGPRAIRLFAADCAEHVLHLWTAKYPGDDRPARAIEAARRFAHGEIDKEQLDAAGTAAGTAAGAAAGAAAWAAAGAAAGDATGDAAWAATWAAAGDATGDAAGDATGDAAGDAENSWQFTRLIDYLEGA